MKTSKTLAAVAMTGLLTTGLYAYPNSGQGMMQKGMNGTCGQSMMQGNMQKGMNGTCGQGNMQKRMNSTCGQGMMQGNMQGNMHKGMNKGMNKAANCKMNSQKKMMKQKAYKRGNQGPLSILKELNLSAEQHKQIRDIRDDIRKNRATPDVAFTKDSFDKAKYIEIMKQKRDYKIEAKAEMIDRVYNILTAQQKEQFKVLMDLRKEKRMQMMERMNKMHKMNNMRNM